MCNYHEIVKNSFYKLKIKYQVFLGVISIILINLLLITFIITLNVFLLSNSAYKDIINNLDNMDFEQLTYYAISAENGNMHLSELMRTYVGVVADLKHIIDSSPNSVGLIHPALIEAGFPNFAIHFDNFDATRTPTRTLLYFSPTRTMAELDASADFQKEIKLIKTLTPTIMAARFVKVFNNKFEQTDLTYNYFDRVVMVNYNLNTVFYYPGNATEINTKVDLADVKTYIIRKFKEMREFVEMTTKIRRNLSYNFTNKNSINLPLYLEQDIYDKFFLPGLFDFKIMVAFNIYKKPVEVDLTNYLDKIDETIFVFSRKSTTTSVYDVLMENVPATTMLVADFQYPYKLFSEFQCGWLMAQSDFNIPRALEVEKKYLADCFNKTRVDPVLDEDDAFVSMSEKEQLFDSLLLVNDMPEFPITPASEIVIQQAELAVFGDKLLSSTITNSTLSVINGVPSKVLKTYLPLSSYEMFQYYYPVTYINLNIVIKNEEMFRNNKKFVFMKSIGNFITSFVGSLVICYTILIFIVYHLIQVMQLIDKPINLINDAVQSISEKDKFNEAKASLEKYIYDTNNDEVIDEFVDLTSIILDMIEGNMNLKQEMTQTALCRLKMEEEKVNREFEMIKINNLLVMDDLILEHAEKKNYFNDILKINLDKEIFEDEKVKTCSIFMKIFEKHRKITKRSQANRYDLSRTLKFNEDGQFLVFKAFPFKQKQESSYIDRRQSTAFTKKSTIRDKPEEEERLKTEDINKSLSSYSSDNNEDEVNIFQSEQKVKKKMKKMFNIKDDYILGKLRRQENILFNAYSQLKDQVYESYLKNFILDQ